MTADLRRERLRERLHARAPQAEAMLVTSLVNVRYLSGFTGSHAILIVSARDADADVLITDGRYVEQAGAESADLPLVVERDSLAAAAGVLATRGDTAVEPEHLTLAQWRSLSASMTGVDVIETAGLVEGLRMTKDDDEVAALGRACSITRDALEHVTSGVRPGDTEREIARRLEGAMLDLGADGLAFPSIVAGGPNSAIPHHQPTDRRLEAGDLLKVDFGALVDGYHADMTRTFVVGRAPEPWQAEVHAIVAESQAAGRRAVRNGADVRSIDDATRTVIAEAGFADAFVHGTGHGVGLQIHEAPLIGARSTGTIAPAMAITVEPGIYLPGRGGVRIEDTLLVGDHGVTCLTEAPRELRVLG